MSEASYERQHLATHAAGYINGAGTTVIAFGCRMTRLDTGHYGLILDANSGVVNDETFTQVQVKGTTLLVHSVEDVSNLVKAIRVSDGASLTDSDIEVILYKSVTK